MKNLMLLLLTAFSTSIMYGQITEAKKLMSQGEQNALIVTLPDTEEKIVSKEWESFIKDHKGKIRKIKKSSEIFADDAKLEDISNNTVDVYALVSQRGDNTELTVWYDLGGAYLNSETHPDQYKSAMNMLNDFSGIVSKTYIANILQEEQKKLKDMEGALKDAEKSKENSLKDIEKFEQKIEEAKSNIKSAEAQKEEIMKEIESQKMVVKKVKTQLNN